MRLEKGDQFTIVRLWSDKGHRKRAFCTSSDGHARFAAKGHEVAGLIEVDPESIFTTDRYRATIAKKLAKLPSYRINPAKSSGFVAMHKAIMRLRAKPTIVPAAAPRQSTFRSPFVISHF